MKVGNLFHFPFSSQTPLTLLCSVMLTLLLFPSAGWPGQWRVAPVRITLEGAAKSSVITVTNEGEETIHLQGKAMEWIQDADGKDVFQETKDLIFFPRILMLAKGENKLVRAGIKTPAASTEKTYRLFIEEIPQPKQNTTGATQLTVAIRFGVPVFVRPMKQELRGELTSLQLDKGVFSAVVKNTGNVHFRITEISVTGRNDKGEETFAEKLNGWYLLAGAARVYSTPVPADKCAATEQMDITVSTDTEIRLNRQLNVDKVRCRP